MSHWTKNLGSSKTREWIHVGGNGHAAAARWDEVWEGLGWEDMPGSQMDVKKMNFFLWRRGLLHRMTET